MSIETGEERLHSCEGAICLEKFDYFVALCPARDCVCVDVCLWACVGFASIKQVFYGSRHTLS